MSTAFADRPDFPPRTDAAWNEAHERVESYLRAHRIALPITLSDLTNQIVARAWARHPAEPRQPPVTLALSEADGVITDWFARVLALEGPHSRRLGVRGRLALALADAPGRWPGAFLAPTNPPQDLSDAMRAAFLRAGPAPLLSKMMPQDIPLGSVARLVDAGWTAMQRWAAVRLLVRIALLAGLVGLSFLAFR